MNPKLIIPFSEYCPKCGADISSIDFGSIQDFHGIPANALGIYYKCGSSEYAKNITGREKFVMTTTCENNSLKHTVEILEKVLDALDDANYMEVFKKTYEGWQYSRLGNDVWICGKTLEECLRNAGLVEV